jgi:hypothetical protein
MVAGRVRRLVFSEVGEDLEIVELRFNAADATKPPAPRVEGINHGIDVFVGEADSLGVGNDSVR